MWIVEFKCFKGISCSLLKVCFSYENKSTKICSFQNSGNGFYFLQILEILKRFFLECSWVAIALCLYQMRHVKHCSNTVQSYLC